MGLKQKLLPRLYRIRVAFGLFQESSKPSESKSTAKSEAQTTNFSRIRCPLCQWQPNALSRWFCADCDYPEYFFAGCGTNWNTFTTQGRCPGCGHQWRWTSCLRCARWSLHQDWYEKDANNPLR
jgi:hypothetical protein